MKWRKLKWPYPLSSTSWTVLFVSLKLKHRLTFMPNFPVGVAKKLSYSIMFCMQMNELNYHLTGRNMLSVYTPGRRWLAVLCLAHESAPSWREMSHSCIWNMVIPFVRTEVSTLRFLINIDPFKNKEKSIKIFP